MILRDISEDIILLQFTRTSQPLQQNNNKQEQMSKPKARRVNYRINYCSSQDAQYPVSELVLQSAEARGWISKRFAPFPQTIVIQLLETTIVTNLAFLSHQNKICTRIDIEGKQDHEDNWSKLGYTTLESGVNTNYQSRQLRNINLGGKVLLLLKFTFYQNYTNHINIFNQIGLIALLVYGQKATVEKQWVRGKEGNVMASLSDLDRETIMKLKNLQLIKRDAVEEHRFQDAKSIKEDIETLQGHLQALIVLERDKKEAIKRENYDDAKQIVERMKKLRGPMVFHRSNPLSANNSLQLAKSGIYSPKKKLPKSMMADYNDSISAQGQDFYKMPDRRSEPRSRKGFDLNTPKRKNSVVPFDQIKISARERYPVEQQLQKQNEGSVHLFNPKKPLPPKYNKSPRTNKDLSLDDEFLQPRPLPIMKKVQKLTHDQVSECNRYFSIFNQVTFEYLLSKDHVNRQKGVTMINGVMNEMESEDKKEADQFVMAALFAVRKLIDDRIMSVLAGVVDFFGMMMRKFRPGLIGPASKNIRYILDRLAQYLGHNNQKFRQTCEDVFASLPSHKLTNRQLCFEVLMGNPKQKSPRVVAGKLKMLDDIIDKYHLSQDVDELIDFGKRYLQDKNSEVRVAAVDLMATLSREMGYENLYQDLEGLKPQVIKMIEDQIVADGGVIKKIQVKKHISSKKIANISPKAPQSPKQPTNPEYYCDYCKIFDKRFQNQNFRDQHLYSSCKLITLCPQCNQAIQVSSLNNHLLTQCQKHKYFKRCPKCKQAVPSKQYNQHTKMKECIPAKAPALANRCPLCHEDIETGDRGWVKHLVTEGCPNNPRT